MFVNHIGTLSWSVAETVLAFFIAVVVFLKSFDPAIFPTEAQSTGGRSTSFVLSILRSLPPSHRRMSMPPQDQPHRHPFGDLVGSTHWHYLQQIESEEDSVWIPAAKCLSIASQTKHYWLPLIDQWACGLVSLTHSDHKEKNDRGAEICTRLNRDRHQGVLNSVRRSAYLYPPHVSYETQRRLLFHSELQVRDLAVCVCARRFEDSTCEWFLPGPLVRIVGDLSRHEVPA
jgi:hypothetical protein